MDIAAVSLGAGMIEKTITENRFTKSCEHSFSLELDDSIRFIESIRQLEIALGNNRRVIPRDIKKGRNKTRRSPYSLKELSKGDKINFRDFEFKRPGYGLSFDEFEFLVGKSLNSDLKLGDILTIDMISW